MALKSVTNVAPVLSPTAQPELFSLNGKYQVAPGTTCNDLQNDIGCWLEAIHGTVDLIVDGLQEEGGQIAANPRMVARALYGVIHHVEMVEGAVSALFELERRESAAA